MDRWVKVEFLVAPCECSSPGDTRIIVPDVAVCCVLLVFGGYGSFAFGNYEDLFGCVGVEFVAGACGELNVDNLDFLGLMLFFQNKPDGYFSAEK